MKTFESHFWIGPDHKRVFVKAIQVECADIEELRGQIEMVCTTPFGFKLPHDVARLMPTLIITKEFDRLKS